MLICAFLTLAVYYQTNVTQHLDHPRESEVSENDASANQSNYIGQNVSITGVVTATGVCTFGFKGVHGTFTILSSEAVQQGDVVTVVGTLQPGHQLRAVAMDVSPQVLSTGVYVRSFVGLIVLVVLFFVSWRVDWRGLVVRPREPNLDTKSRGW